MQKLTTILKKSQSYDALTHLKGADWTFEPAMSKSQRKQKIVENSKWLKINIQEKLFDFQIEG